MIRETVHDLEAEALLSTLRSLEEKFFSPELRSSAELVGNLLAEGFVEFGRSGNIYDREQIIDALAAEAVVSEAAERTAEHFRLKQLAKGVFLLTYRSTRRSRGRVAHSLRSSIWKWGSGRWQMVFHQGTPTDS